MIDDTIEISTLDELREFLAAVENGGLGFNNSAGVALATQNSTGRPFVAVLDDKHQLLLGRWVSQDVYENGKEIVRFGSKHQS